MLTARGHRRIVRNTAAIAPKTATGRVNMFLILQCEVQIVPSLKRNSSRGAHIPDDVWHPHRI